MKRILVRDEYCIGCRLCEVYCITEHSNSKNIVKVFKYENPEMTSKLFIEELEYMTFAIQCRHCEDAVCIATCITGAMHRDEKTNVVQVDRDKCVGCWMCIMACPYGVIRRDTGGKVASKCDLCMDRETPACVEHCPNGALVLVEVER